MNGPWLALAVAGAGGVGSGLRYLLDLAVPARARFPWALLLINTTGSFALGLLVGATASHTWQLVIGTGLLGGFTTFSSAIVDAAGRWIDGRRPEGLLSAAGMLLACVAAAALGASL